MIVKEFKILTEDNKKTNAMSYFQAVTQKGGFHYHYLEFHLFMERSRSPEKIIVCIN